jgi:hypothetical protein
MRRTNGLSIRPIPGFLVRFLRAVTVEWLFPDKAAAHLQRTRWLSGDDRLSRSVNRRIFLRCNGRVATSIATAERLRGSLPSEPGGLVDLIT